MYSKLNQSGSVLLALIIMMPFFLLVVVSYMELAVNNYSISKKDQYRTHAQFAADAGVDVALEEINLDNNWLGSSELEMPGGDPSVRTTYETFVATPDDDKKTVISTGRTYFPASNTTPSSTITLTTQLRPVRSGEFSVVSGVGGLEMSNSSKILGGDVHINGKLDMSNSAQIGQTISPVNLSVAHQNCPLPPDSTYPRICGDGEEGEPISMSNSAHIYGNVKANNQTEGSDMSNPGLIASSGVGEQALPEYDRAAQISAVNSTQTGSSAGCSGGSKTWSANLKITGNVSITNSCKVTVSGNVWITGSLSVRNSAKMIVNDSLVNTKPTIMVDGSYAKFSNGAELKSNSSDTGFYIITYKSANGCTIENPGCASIGGTDLYNSRDDLTIELSNSAEGPNTIFYARWSKIKVSNSGQIGALIGQTIELSNAGAITFGTSAGIETEYWVIDSIKRTYN